MDRLENLQFFRDFNDSLDLCYEMNNFEFEQGECPPILKGRLKNNIDYWKSINANSFAVDVISHGYKIPFVENPSRVRLNNNKSALDNSDFVHTAISELLENHSVVETPFIPHVVNPLSVSVQSSGKKRLILDLRHVNLCVWKQKFKFEDWRALLDYVEKDYFLFSFDLKSGYHHIEILPEHQTFLGFSWTSGNTTKYYCFTVLPFGLTSAPFVFTKVLRPLVKFWRYNGVKIVLYLDDGCGTCQTLNGAKEHSNLVKTSLKNAGFVINSSKSNWDPCQSLLWLGLEWDLTLGRIKITDNRISNFLVAVQSLLDKAPYVNARDCATITGHVMSMSPVVGNLCRLKTRHLYKVIESRSNWYSRINIGIHNDALEEIFYWKNNIVKLNSRFLFSYRVPQFLSFSDASNVGCGGFLKGNEGRVCYRMWTANERAKSSTWRELKAIQFCLLAFRSSLEGNIVKWHSDNQGAVSILEVGSPKSELHAIAIDIFSFCKNNKVILLPEWVPRDLNCYADNISKMIDHDDWVTTKEFFLYIDSFWGPHTVDRFADSFNSHLPRFNSRFQVPGTERVDAFSVNWGGENNWLVPPLHQVTQVILHTVASSAQGTLIVPYWPSSGFWPYIFTSANALQPYVGDIIVFPPFSGIFALGNFKDSLLGSVRFNSSVLAVRLKT